MPRVKNIYRALVQKWQQGKQNIRLLLSLARIYLFSKKIKRNAQNRAAVAQLININEQLLDEQQAKPVTQEHPNSDEAKNPTQDQSAGLEHLVAELFGALGSSDKMGGQIDSLLSHGLNFKHACSAELSATVAQLIADELAPYVTRTEFEPFNAHLAELTHSLESTQKQLNQLTRCHEIN